MSTRTTRDDSEHHPALPYLLAIAVYQDIDEVRRLPADVLQREAIAAADVIASGGDRLLRWEPPGARGGRAGRAEYQAVWNATVRGLAIAAMQPGGVRFLGQHFQGGC